MAVRACAIAIVSLVATSIAVAQPGPPEPPGPAGPDKWFHAGVDAFRLGKYADARAYLEKAAALGPTLPGPHRFLAAVAQAERRWDDCVASAREAIRLNPKSSEIDATRAVHDACRAGLGRTGFTGDYGTGGAIAVSANIDGASVTVGGLRYGATPMAPRALATGSVEVVVEKNGWKPVRLTADILPKVVTDVVVRLEPAPGTSVEVGPKGGVDPTTHGWLVLGTAATVPGVQLMVDGKPVAAVESVPLPGGVHEVIVEAPGHERWRRRVRITRGQRQLVEVEMPTRDERDRRRRVGVLVIAGAGVMAGVGIASAAVSHRAAERARDYWTIETSRPFTVPVGDTTDTEPVHTRDDIEGLRDRARTFSIVSLAAYGVAIAGAGIGGYLLFRQRPVDISGQPAPFAVTPTVSPGGLGARVEVAW